MKSTKLVKSSSEVHVISQAEALFWDAPTVQIPLTIVGSAKSDEGPVVGLMGIFGESTDGVVEGWIVGP